MYIYIYIHVRGMGGRAGSPHPDQGARRELDLAHEARRAWRKI